MCSDYTILTMVQVMMMETRSIDDEMIGYKELKVDIIT